MKTILMLSMILFVCSCKQKSTNSNVSNDSLSKQGLKGYKVFPFDESSNDPSLVDFLKKLKDVIKQKDTASLYCLLDTEVVVSYGGALYGKKAFVEEWRLNQPESSKLWNELSSKLKLGGAFEKEEDNQKIFRIPYASSNKAYGQLDFEFDCFSTAVCINPKEPVHESSDPSSKIIGYLQYDIVQLNGSSGKGKLTKIKTYDNKIEGFIDGMSLIDCAESKLDLKKNKNGQWKIMSLAPFD